MMSNAEAFPRRVHVVTRVTAGLGLTVPLVGLAMFAVLSRDGALEASEALFLVAPLPFIARIGNSGVAAAFAGRFPALACWRVATWRVRVVCMARVSILVRPAFR
jgi:hypothetical protein